LLTFQKKSAKLSLESKKLNLNYQVAEVYFNLLRLDELIKISKKQLISSKEQLKRVTEKISLGLLKKSDKLQWKVKVQNDKIVLEQALNNRSALKTYWKNLLNLSKITETLLPDKIKLPEYDKEILKYANLSEVEKEVKIKKIQNQVKVRNADIKNLSVAEKISKKNLDIAKGNFLPAINMQYTRQIESDDRLNLKGDSNWNVAIVASVPLFHSGANFTKLKKSKAGYERTKLLLQNTEEKILIGAKNAFYELVITAKKVKSSKLSIKNAKENYRIINDFFAQGMATNKDLLDAEIMLFATKIQLTNSYYDFILAKYNINKFINK